MYALVSHFVTDIRSVATCCRYQVAAAKKVCGTRRDDIRVRRADPTTSLCRPATERPSQHDPSRDASTYRK